MSPVLAPEPPGTAAPTVPSINKRGSLKQKKISQQSIFRGKKKIIQGNPAPVKCDTAKGARSKVKKASKPNSFPGDKIVSEKEILPAIKSLLIQKILNAKMKEWEKIAIEPHFARLKHQTSIHKRCPQC